jgi:uncharacterized protein (DUF1697 family)
MTTWIALFRGINVGGKNVLPMKSLVAILAKLGHRDIQTYIQSGNAVFRSAKKKAADVEQQISAAVAKTHGFRPRVLALEVRDLQKAIAANPFSAAAAHPQTLHLYFLTQAAAQPDIKALNELKAKNESFVITKKVFYLHAPEGIGKSKLAGRVEKCLQVDATARNWQTVSNVFEMARGLSR